MSEQASLVGLLPVALALGVLIGSLLTGKTPNPLKGFSPMFVGRVDLPKFYWMSIFLWIIFLAFAVYFNMDTLK